MASATELNELERGDGSWENIQEVLRFAFRGLWNAFAGVDVRVATLETSMGRQQRHLEALAQTLNTMSEQLRADDERATRQQVQTRLGRLEGEFQAQQASEKRSEVSADKAVQLEHRLELLEEELGHVVAAVDRKAEADAALAQGKRLHDALRKRCKKSAFDQEVRVLHQQLERQSDELDKRLAAATSELKTMHETLLRSEVDAWTAKTQQDLRARELQLEHALRQQAATMEEHAGELRRCQDGLAAQQSSLHALQEATETETRALNEAVAVCRDAHERLGHELRGQEAALKRANDEQQQWRLDAEAARRERAEKTAEDTCAALDALARRVLARQRSEATELRETLANGRSREQRRLQQQQHVVGRKLAELDQMLQLVGRQLIQNTSQLQVVRDVQLERSVQLDLEQGTEHVDDELLLQYGDRGDDVELLAPGPPTHRPAGSPPSLEQASSVQAEPDAVDDSLERQQRRSQHEELQLQLAHKLRDYRQLLQQHTQTDAPPQQGARRE